MHVEAHALVLRLLRGVPEPHVDEGRGCGLAKIILIAEGGVRSDGGEVLDGRGYGQLQATWCTVENDEGIVAPPHDPQALAVVARQRRIAVGVDLAMHC